MLPEGWKKEIVEAAEKKDAGKTATIVGLYLNAALVFVTAVIFYCQLRVFESTDKAVHDGTIAANRAWIAPMTVQFDGEVVPQQEASYHIAYRNIGRLPAVNLRAITEDAHVPLPLNDGPPAVPDNTVCKQERPQGGSVTYPAPDGLYYSYSSLKAAEISEDLINGRIIEYLQGCYFYDTMTTVGHSPYCFYLVPKPGTPIEAWQFKNCPAVGIPD